MNGAPEYAFITPAPILRAGDAIYSPGSVARARTLAPMFALNALGYEAWAYSLAADAGTLAATVRRAKGVVLGEVTSETLKRYRSLLPDVVPRAAIDLAEFFAFQGDPAVLTTGSRHIAARAGAQHVPDAYAGPALAPSAARARSPWKFLRALGERVGLAAETFRIRLLWSGEDDAVAELYPALEALGRRMPLSLRCLCPQGPILEGLADRLVEKDPDALRIALEGWTPQAMADALAGCDLVLLPDATGLVNAIHAGRFAVARSSPHHGPLAEFAWIGDDVATGISWALKNPRDVLDKLARGQAHVDRVHAPEVVARAWLEVFQRIKK